jgi:ABC-type branched-subunit amino acid transport system substrate-binding protein
VTGVIARRTALALAMSAALLAGCDEPDDGPAIRVGLLLSYSGHLAPSSTNSERGLRMAFDAANQAGGVGGRRLRLVTRDTRSEAATVGRPAAELVAAGVAMIVGPDLPELAVPLVPALREHTLILPSFATAHSPFRRPDGWFVMGAGTALIACELQAQLKADRRVRPLVLTDPTGYNSLVAWELTRTYGIPQLALSNIETPTTDTVRAIMDHQADAYVLMTSPPAAASLVYAMAALGKLEDPRRWYLSPTLHTPALLETIPKGVLAGARGVAPGTGAGATDFSVAFSARWHEAPLDDAYPFFDAGAVAALALQRAVTREPAVEPGPGLWNHVRAVTRAGGTQVRWHELKKGLELLRDPKNEVEYVGLSGPLQFDISGQTPTASTNWWTVDRDGFLDIPGESDCF